MSPNNGINLSCQATALFLLLSLKASWVLANYYKKPLSHAEVLKEMPSAEGYQEKEVKGIIKQITHFGSTEQNKLQYRLKI